MKQKWTVEVKMNDGTTEFWECEAESEFDARQQAGWAFLREGTVKHAYLES